MRRLYLDVAFLEEFGCWAATPTLLVVVVAVDCEVELVDCDVIVVDREDGCEATIAAEAE